MRQCTGSFLLALTGVMKTRQYSIEYYSCWALVYLSFFFMLPSVLPTDTTKIRVVLWATFFNMLCAAGFAVRFAYRKSHQPCDFEPYVCSFLVGFWVVHFVMALFIVLSSLYALRLTPADGLHAFWRSFGIYFLLLGAVSAFDLAVLTAAGKYDRPEYRVAFWGNLVMTTLQFAIGRLCHSARFKNFMWRYAASTSIKLDPPTKPTLMQQVNDHCSDLFCWLLPSAVLVFLLAILAHRPTDISRVS